MGKTEEDKAGIKAPNISNTLKGKAFEDKAVAFLEEKGYEILERNSHFHHLEMDLVAKDGETLCFIEVKGRNIAIFPVFMQWIEENKGDFVPGLPPIFVNMHIH